MDQENNLQQLMKPLMKHLPKHFILFSFLRWNQHLPWSLHSQRIMSSLRIPILQTSVPPSFWNPSWFHPVVLLSPQVIRKGLQVLWEIGFPEVGNQKRLTGKSVVETSRVKTNDDWTKRDAGGCSRNFHQIVQSSSKINPRFEDLQESLADYHTPILEGYFSKQKSTTFFNFRQSRQTLFYNELWDNLSQPLPFTSLPDYQHQNAPKASLLCLQTLQENVRHVLRAIAWGWLWIWPS